MNDSTVSRLYAALLVMAASPALAQSVVPTARPVAALSAPTPLPAALLPGVGSLALRPAFAASTSGGSLNMGSAPAPALRPVLSAAATPDRPAAPALDSKWSSLFDGRVPTAPEVRDFLSAVMPRDGGWTAFPGKPNDIANPSIERRPGSIVIKTFNESDRRFNWFGLIPGVRTIGHFALSEDAPTERVVRVKRAGDVVTIDARRDKAGRGYYGRFSYLRQRLILTLDGSGKAVAMTIKNWNNRLGLFKQTRTAEWGAPPKIAPWVQ